MDDIKEGDTVIYQGVEHTVKLVGFNTKLNATLYGLEGVLHVVTRDELELVSG